jgi:pyruvate dehydrogenase E1 component beta subunit
MRERRFSEAIDEAVAAAMAADRGVVVIGEDVPMIRAPLFARFGPERVLGAPISESAFVGAALGAAMGGLRPIVEVMIVDFIAVAMDAVLNQIAKLEAFSGGNWSCPLVIRAACGGGYGDGGQHEQSLWGMLAGIPGLKVVVPSTPADAKGLMASAIEDAGPVVFLEHKLLSEVWLEWMGRGGRENVAFDVPPAGALGEVPDPASEIRIGEAVVRREGEDVTLVSLAVGAHRATEAAERLAAEQISAEVIDLRSVRPLDVDLLLRSVEKTRRVVVVDEDYRDFGLSGEIAAVLLEADLHPLFRRVCLEATLPYDRRREEVALPSVERIVAAVETMTGSSPPSTSVG